MYEFYKLSVAGNDLWFDFYTSFLYGHPGVVSSIDFSILLFDYRKRFCSIMHVPMFLNVLNVLLGFTT